MPAHHLGPWPDAGRFDVLNHSRREYGNRVGAWRCLELFDQLDLPTAAIVNTALRAKADLRARDAGHRVVENFSDRVSNPARLACHPIEGRLGERIPRHRRRFIDEDPPCNTC